MAVRPVFVVSQTIPFYKECEVEFKYNGGFAATQKQKNIKAIHEGYILKSPGAKILEISSKSLQSEGVLLSAFNLLKFVPAIDKSIPVENVFQGSKVFSLGGPYTDLYHKTPRDAKRDERLRNSGPLMCFRFTDEVFPLNPKTTFYDWIYINALLENPALCEKITEYDTFTDVEFNPNKSINCQARAAAIFVSLKMSGELEKIKTFNDFLNITYGVK